MDATLKFPIAVPIPRMRPVSRWTIASVAPMTQHFFPMHLRASTTRFRAVPRRAARWWVARGAVLAALAVAAAGPQARAADLPAAQAVDAVALVKRVSGTAQLQRANGQQPLQEGQSLVATDRLVTGADGLAAVVFRDGTQLTVGASTDLQLRRYAFEPKSDDYAFDVYLAKGRAVYASGKIGKLAPQTVRLDTPTATVGVRGTRLILEAE